MNQNLEIDSDIVAEDLQQRPIHSSKNSDFGNVGDVNENTGDEFDSESEQDEYPYEEDEEDKEEELFEDAVDEVVAQNVLDCIDESSESSEESRQFSDAVDMEPRSNLIAESSTNESDVNRQVKILLERQRK